MRETTSQSPGGNIGNRPDNPSSGALPCNQVQERCMKMEKAFELFIADEGEKHTEAWAKLLLPAMLDVYKLFFRCLYLFNNSSKLKCVQLEIHPPPQDINKSQDIHF